MAKSSLTAKHWAIVKLIANKSVRRIALENALICLFTQNPRNLGRNRVVFSYVARAKAWQKRTPGSLALALAVSNQKTQAACVYLPGQSG